MDEWEGGARMGERGSVDGIDWDDRSVYDGLARRLNPW